MGIGVGIPILVEGLTFLGLVGEQIVGNGDEDEDENGDDEPAGVGIGDELVPATEQRETLSSAVVRASETEWRLNMTVEVENTGDTDYEFQMLSITTVGGETIEGKATTGRLAPGETKAITGEWLLPEGATPGKLDVVGLSYPSGGGSPDAVSETVDIGKIPVRYQ